MNKVKKVLLLLLSLIIGLGIHRTVVADMIMRFFPSLYVHTWIHVVAMIFEGIFIYIVLSQIIYKNVSKKCIYVMWACYFLSLTFVLFIRLMGNRGINLNPLDFVKNIYEDPIFFITIIMNILAFMPIGYLFKKKTLKVSVLSAIVICLAIELLQYIFKVGIFDVDDIVFNVIGIILGWKFGINYKGIKVSRESKAV